MERLLPGEQPAVFRFKETRSSPVKNLFVMAFSEIFSHFREITSVARHFVFAASLVVNSEWLLTHSFRNRFLIADGLENCGLEH